MAIVFENPELERLVIAAVDRGEFQTTDELLSCALELLLKEDPQELPQISAAIAEGFEQAERGESRSAVEVFSKFRRKHGIPH